MVALWRLTYPVPVPRTWTSDTVRTVASSPSNPSITHSIMDLPWGKHYARALPPHPSISSFLTFLSYIDFKFTSSIFCCTSSSSSYHHQNRVTHRLVNLWGIKVSKWTSSMTRTLPDLAEVAIHKTTQRTPHRDVTPIHTVHPHTFLCKS